MSDPEDHEAGLADLRRRIREHPAYIEHEAVTLLYRSITAVFIPNVAELLSQLDRAATDEALAVELAQNVRPPVAREAFEKLLTRRLNNYLASAMALVDHARRVMRHRTGPLADEFEERKATVIAEPVISFVQDLRNFTLHRSLPFFGHALSFTNTATGTTFESEVELAVSPLLEWPKWSSASRGFLEESRPAVILRPVIRRHGELVFALNGWLHRALGEANEAGLAEVNALQTEYNAVLLGVDLATAERLTAERTAIEHPDLYPDP